MIERGRRIYCQRVFERWEVDFWLRDVETRAFAKPIEMGDPHDETRPPPGPFMSLDEGECQSLIDALWESGIRPTAVRNEGGAIGAVREHLADMRQIVSKKIGVDL